MIRSHQLCCTNLQEFSPHPVGSGEEMQGGVEYGIMKTLVYKGE